MSALSKTARLDIAENGAENVTRDVIHGARFTLGVWSCKSGIVRADH